MLLSVLPSLPPSHRESALTVLRPAPFICALADTFVFRQQDGITSVMLDDDTCDCHTSLSMGASMCGDGNGWSYNGGTQTKGVDVLSDNGCSTPQEGRKLALFFRSIEFSSMDSFCANDNSWHCAMKGRLRAITN